jgi:hypothetical protein
MSLLTVPEPVTERTVEAYSRADANGTPYFNTCQLIVGDGTVKIAFEKGRADIPVSLAALIASIPGIHVPGMDGTTAPVPVDGALAAENEMLRLRLAEMETMLKLLAAKPKAAAETTRVFVDNATPEGGDSTEITGIAPEDLPESVRLAMEHLAAEGEDVPEPGSALPAPASIDALAALTTDGQARCQAVKGDGSQCSNPAVGESGACAISAHKTAT